MREENPYTGLLGMMREEGAARNPSGCILGEVQSVQPLKVLAGGLDLDGDDLLVNATLLSGYARQVSYAGSVCESSGFSGKLTAADDFLKKGDLVLLVPSQPVTTGDAAESSSGQQQYFLVCKLVEVK